MKKYYGIIVFVFLVIGIGAVEANDFLIGAYSQYAIRYAGNDYANNFELLGTFLQNSGYNAAIYGSAYNYIGWGTSYPDRIPVILDIMAGKSIKTIMDDNYWNPGGGKISLKPLSFGNELKIEAEYQLITDSTFVPAPSLPNAEENCLESYNYVTEHEVGYQQFNQALSNNYAWVCDPSVGHTAGQALHKPRKRWKPSGEQWPGMLSNDISIH